MEVLPMEIQAATQTSHDQSGEHRQDMVTIRVNNVEINIHRGRQTVSEIKRVGGVPQADVLEQNVAGKLEELDDAGAVTIKGGEQFISHPRDSASS
jgi:predicted Rdx family selenoprotein